MNTIFSNLPEKAFPSKLHARMMRAFYFQKYKLLIQFGCVISAINSAIFLWLTVAQAREMETIEAIKDIFQGFEATYSFLADLVSIFFIYAPINIMIATFANVVVLACIVKLYVHLRQGISFFSFSNSAGRTYD